MRAVRQLPSPTVLLPGLAAGVSEVSRFSCMKFLGVPGVFDYAGLRSLRKEPNVSCTKISLYIEFHEATVLRSGGCCFFLGGFFASGIAI